MMLQLNNDTLSEMIKDELPKLHAIEQAKTILFKVDDAYTHGDYKLCCEELLDDLGNVVNIQVWFVTRIIVSFDYRYLWASIRDYILEKRGFEDIRIQQINEAYNNYEAKISILAH